MKKTKPTLRLRQRRWTTNLSILKTKETAADLGQRVLDAFNKAGVNLRDDTLVLTDMGFLRHGKMKGFPAVRSQDDDWYLLQPSASIEPGQFYSGSIGNGDNIGIFEHIAGKRQINLDNGAGVSVTYNSKKPITLEEALRLQRGYVPIYQGTIQDFVIGYLGGLFKKSNPINAKITANGKVEVKGNMIVSEEDYRALSNYLLRHKGQPPSKTTKRLLQATITPRRNEDKADAGRNGEANRNYAVGPQYLRWIKQKDPSLKYARQNSPAAVSAFEEQRQFDVSVMPALEGIEEVVKDVMMGYLEPKYVSARVAYLEQVPTGKKGKHETAWVAYVKDKSGKIAGFYFVHPRARDISEVVYSGGNIVNEISPPRAMSFDLKYWPNQDVSPKEVKRDDLWMTGVESDVVIEGLTAVPSNRKNPYVYGDSTLLGVVGMRKETWRSILVKMVANNIADNLNRHQLETGVDDGYILEKALAEYSSNPAIRSVDRGGSKAFADSVLRVVRSYDIGRVEERQLTPLTPKK